MYMKTGSAERAKNRKQTSRLHAAMHYNHATTTRKFILLDTVKILYRNRAACYKNVETKIVRNLTWMLWSSLYSCDDQN